MKIKPPKFALRVLIVVALGVVFLRPDEFTSGIWIYLVMEFYAWLLRKN